MKKKKWMSSSDRAQRIVDAAKELHEACYDAWNREDGVALRAASATVADIKRIAYDEGQEVEGWSGGVLFQGDAAVAVLKLLKSYDLPA